jgi:hypothetical protein
LKMVEMFYFYWVYIYKICTKFAFNYVDIHSEFIDSLIHLAVSLTVFSD